MAVVSSPGPRPPSQALNMIAGKSVMNGSFAPQIGSSDSRRRMAANAAAIASE
jgi:hypothetical protein